MNLVKLAIKNIYKSLSKHLIYVVITTVCIVGLQFVTNVIETNNLQYAKNIENNPEMKVIIITGRGKNLSKEIVEKYKNKTGVIDYIVEYDIYTDLTLTEREPTSEEDIRNNFITVEIKVGKISEDNKIHIDKRIADNGKYSIGDEFALTYSKKLGDYSIGNPYGTGVTKKFIIDKIVTENNLESYFGNVFVSEKVAKLIYIDKQGLEMSKLDSLGVPKLKLKFDKSENIKILLDEIIDDKLIPQSLVFQLNEISNLKNSMLYISLTFIFFFMIFFVLVTYLNIRNNLNERKSNFAILRIYGYRIQDLFILILTERILLSILSFTFSIIILSLFVNIEFHINNLLYKNSFNYLVFIYCIILVFIVTTIFLYLFLKKIYKYTMTEMLIAHNNL